MFLALSVCLCVLSCMTLCSVHSKATAVHDFDIFPFTTVKLPVIILATKKFSVNQKKQDVCMSTVMLEWFCRFRRLEFLEFGILHLSFRIC